MPKHAFSGPVALLLATTAIAHADVDARTIWSDWQETVARFGGTLDAGSETFADGTLTLSDITISTETAEDDTRIDYGTIRMIEQGDGTVRIELPAKIDTTQEIEAGDEKITQELSVATEGQSLVASETDGVRSYDMSGDMVTVRVEQTGAADTPPTVTTVVMTGLASLSRSGVGGNPQSFAQDLTAETLTMTVDVAAQGDSGGEPVTVRYAATGISGDITGDYGPPRSGPLKGLSNLGIGYDGTFRHSGSTLSVAGDGPEGAFSVDGTSSSGETTMRLGTGSLTYAVRSDAPKMTIKAPNFPVPVAVSLTEISTSTTLPLGVSGAEQPFGVVLALRDLVIDDAIWALFDPTGQLPRDPATLVVDVDGAAVMSVDIFGDPEAMAAADGPPGEVKTLNLNDLTLTALGAALHGTGALTFPEPKPIPEPIGKIELSLDGGFALMDKLVALGFVPAEQAAFIKGMTGAVARPAGDDKLESTIEFTPGGGINANGLPLK